MSNKSKTFIFLVITFFIIVAGFYATRSHFSKPQTQLSQPSVSFPSPTIVSNPTLTWKVFHLETLSFKYPSDWGEPEILNSGFGQAARIENQIIPFQLNVVTGLNKGRTLEENQRFLDEMISGGGKRLQLYNALASVNGITYQGAKAINAYLLTEKNGVYSISLVAAENNPNTESTMDQILSTVRFSD